MNDTTAVAPNTLSPEIFKSKIQIALTKAEISVQALHDAESHLTYNEDHLGVIKLFLENCKSAKATVEKERIKLKEPSLQESRNVDAGAKLVTGDIDALYSKANAYYQNLCQDVEKRRQEAEREAQRVAAIREQMNNFKSQYATKIAGAKTSQEIAGIERLFNLETANTKRYAEFIEEFRADCEAIRSHLRTQKEKVRELEELAKEAEKAAANGSDEQILEIMEKKEVLEAQIAEKHINIQEEALHQASRPAESATVIIPMIPKGGRKLVKWILVDEKAATKKGWTTVVPNKELIDKYLDENREKIIDEEGFIEGGVKFFVEKRF